jgi:hypothetical protein
MFALNDGEKRKMALFNWLRNYARSAFTEVLQNSINQLRLGICCHLLERYIPILGMQNAAMLSVALMNQIVAEEPGNEAGANYLAKNQALIASEAAKLVNDKEVAEIAGLLYAAEIMLLSFSRNPDVARSNKLTERANELGFWITNPYELCGINDPGDMASGKYFDNAIRVIAERSKIVAANTVPYAELVKLDAARQQPSATN